MTGVLGRFSFATAAEKQLENDVKSTAFWLSVWKSARAITRFFYQVEWTYVVHLLRDDEPTTLATRCTLSNEERGDAFGQLQNKQGIFKEQLLD